MGVKSRRDSHGSFLVVSFTASVTVWLLFALPNKQTPCKVMCRFTKRAKGHFCVQGNPNFYPYSPNQIVLKEVLKRNVAKGTTWSMSQSI